MVVILFVIAAMVVAGLKADLRDAINRAEAAESERDSAKREAVAAKEMAIASLEAAQTCTSECEGLRG